MVNGFFEFWIEHEKLPGFLECVQQRQREAEPSPPSIAKDPLLYFCFAHDADLYGFYVEDARVENPDFIPENTLPSYIAGPFEVFYNGIPFSLAPLSYNWLESEPFFTKVSFTNINSLLVPLFQSSSVRQFFIELAREGGATSLHVDYGYSPAELLYLDGLDGQEQGVFGPQNYPNETEFCRDHPRDWREFLGLKPSPSEAIEKLYFCDSISYYPLQRQVERLLQLLHDEDAGVRARACIAFERSMAPQAFEVATRLLDDPDWRVFAVAQSLWSELLKQRIRDGV